MAIGARKQPLYDQLVDILTEKIDHEYRAGDMIPSERELSERYGLSRTTVRLALQELERLGLVVRQHGRGTFVTDRSAKATNLMQSYSFTEQMRAMGREPETTILEFCEMEADKNLAEHMGLRIGDRIFKLKRLRSADNMPMMVERSYLPGLSAKDSRGRRGVLCEHSPSHRCPPFGNCRGLACARFGQDYV